MMSYLRKHTGVFIVALMLIVMGLVFLVVRSENGRTKNDNKQSLEDKEDKVISIAANEYKIKYPVKTYLIMGIDDSGGIEKDGYYYGNTADALFVLVVDDKRKTFGVWQIDRNTMANVSKIDNFGQDGGSYFMQINLGHMYGGSEDAASKNECKIVSELMGGVDIDGYYSVPVEAIPILNDAVGGVTVTVEDDFSDVSDTLKQGETVTLKGNDAELFVRSRMEIGDGRNESRMRRQKEYATAFYEQLTKKCREDDAFAANFFTKLKSESTTNIAMEELVEMLSDKVGYDNLGIFKTDNVIEQNETFMNGYIFEESYMNYDDLQEIMKKLYPLEKQS